MSSKTKRVSDYLLAAEAAVMLVIAKLAIHLLPLRTLGRYLGSRRAGAESSVDRIGMAVERAARRLPTKFVCYPRALAVHWMLRRRGEQSLLHFGVRPPSADFSAHVWTSLDGVIVVGAEGAAGLDALITYPAPNVSPTAKRQRPANGC